MGGSSSKADKSVENQGQVQNNVVIDESGMGQANYQSAIFIMVGIICFIKIAEFVYFVYRTHFRNIKKKYTNNAVSNNNLRTIS